MRSAKFIIKKYHTNFNLFHIVAILFCIAIVFFPVYQFQFLIGWDDQWFVTNYFTEGGLNLKNIYPIFTTFYYGQYARFFKFTLPFFIPYLDMTPFITTWQV